MTNYGFAVIALGIVLIFIDNFKSRWKIIKSILLFLIIIFQVFDSKQKDSESTEKDAQNLQAIKDNDSKNKIELLNNLNKNQKSYEQSVEQNSKDFSMQLTNTTVQLRDKYEEGIKRSDENAREMLEKLDSSSLKHAYIGFIAEPTNAFRITYDSANKVNHIAAYIRNHGQITAYKITFDMHIIGAFENEYFIASDTSKTEGILPENVNRRLTMAIKGDDFLKSEATFYCLINGSYLNGDKPKSGKKEFHICAWIGKNVESSNLVSLPIPFDEIKKIALKIN